jgi:hypothetical protein
MSRLSVAIKGFLPFHLRDGMAEAQEDHTLYQSIDDRANG